MRIYFAGPDIFRPDYKEHCERIRAWCGQAGVEALLPSDEELPEHIWRQAPDVAAQWIFAENVQMIMGADCLICHLEPFRGDDVDSGTAFEVGVASAHGLPVFGVIKDGRSLVDRLAVPTGQPSECRVDRDGNMVENFDFPCNLMIACACTSIESGFELAIRRAKEHYLYTKPQSARRMRA